MIGGFAPPAQWRGGLEARAYAIPREAVLSPHRAHDRATAGTRAALPRVLCSLISSLTKRWPRQQDPVLRDIDLKVGAGELAWLTGENGAGKTTLLRIIAGIIAPNTGRVRVCGLESPGARRAYQQRIGLLTAGNSGLYARMTARQHLDYWARLALVRPRTETSASRSRSNASRSVSLPGGAWTACRWGSVSACGSRWPSCIVLR